MRTITLVAYNRPSYVAAVLSALSQALLTEVEGQFNPRFDELIISIDPGNPLVAEVCEKAAQIFAETGVIGCTVYVNLERFGIAGNTLAALQRAFETHDSEFNLSIEDDALLTKDALLLADWFYTCHGGPASDYTLMSMCNHRDFGKGKNPGNVPNDPSIIFETPYITSPFAWCASVHQWPFIARTWDKKELPPNGWDFSLSYAMRMEQRRGLHPILSRCKNIGREQSSHGTPDSHDKAQGGLIYSDGTYDGQYRIAGKIPEEELLKIDDWMVSEVRRNSCPGPTFP